jgi:glycosyltransferase involved in cell wall biosynthesis
MMITFVTAYLGGTHGTAKSARDFLRALMANYANVKVVSPVQEEFPAQLCGVMLSKPIWLDVPSGTFRFPCRPWQLRLGNISAWIKETKIRYIFKKEVNSSVVIVNGWASYEYWLSVKRYFNGTKVLIIRESPRHFGNSNHEQSLSEITEIFSKFDHLIFVSERVKLEWIQNLALKNQACSVLPNCCEEEEATECLALDRDQLRSQYGFTPQDFILFCPGTVEYRKGQDLLLKIVPALQESIPNLKVLFVGDVFFDWGQSFLQSIPEEMKGSVIIHRNALPGIIELLRAADILVFPSRAEAMPRTILEAVAVQTPVVASAVDGIPEIVENNRTGLLFECNDCDGLYKSIVTMHQDPDKRTQFAKSGFELYWAHFSRAHQFRKLHAIVSDLLDTHL